MELGYMELGGGGGGLTELKKSCSSTKNFVYQWC